MPGILPGSLADAIRNMISGVSPHLGQQFTDSYQQSPFNLTAIAEVDALNSFWRHQLCLLPFNTVAERECLCVTRDYAVWLDRFKVYILPLIIQYNLPVIRGENDGW